MTKSGTIVVVSFAPDVLHDTAYWAKYFAPRWRQEIPGRIHDRDVSEGGTPDWAPEFEAWLLRSEPSYRYRSPQQEEKDHTRLRTAKVMRRLRSVSPRAYEVLYRLLVLGDSIEGTTEWLNLRAMRNHIPLPPGRTVHYRRKDTVALIIAGVAYAKAYW